MKYVYTLHVGNVGNIWTGSNGAQALREFGAACASSRRPGGRDGWEPVTLTRNGEPWREFAAGPFWFVEATDTFGGERNYSWVRRHKVQGDTMRAAFMRYTKETGQVGSLRPVGPGEYRHKHTCVVVTIEPWDDDQHDTLFHVARI